MDHLLDRCVWNALLTRQRAFAIGDGLALGYHRAVEDFVAASDRSPAALAAMTALVPPGACASMVERAAWPTPPGTRPVRSAVLVQMVAEQLEAADAPFPFLELGDADAPDMLALARLTRPGPFLPRTHALGGFIGVRGADGRLIAMAGERMKAGRFTEVSAVCTHPEARGRGLARGLMSVVVLRIAARGETPFLHSYPDNGGAIALYESLGFRARAEISYTIFERLV